MADATVTPSAVSGVTTIGAPTAMPVRPAAVAVTVDQPHAQAYQPFDTWRPRFSPDMQVMLVCRTNPGDHDTTLTAMTFWAFPPEGFAGDQTTRVKSIPSAYGWTSYGHPEWSPDSSTVVIFVETSTTWDIRLLDSLTYDDFATIYSVNKPDLVTDPSFLSASDVIFVEKSGSTYYLGKITNTATPVHSTILSSSNALADPVLSPDGTTIIYAEQTGAVSGPHPYGQWRLRTLPVVGGSPTTLLDDGNAHRHPTWQTTRLILFQTFRYGTDSTQMVARIKKDGSAHTVLGEGEYPEAVKV